jgi:hypothetical protein
MPLSRRIAINRIPLIVLLVLTGCAKQDPMVTFEFAHGHEKNAPTYRASTADPAIIEKARAELAKPPLERRVHINGKISAGEGNNSPWKWHFNDGEWTLAEMSIELCDGRPSHVNENLEQWLREVGSYCPWASYVSKEL